MIFKAWIYQKFSESNNSWSAIGEFNTETLLFTMTEKSYNNLMTTNDLNNMDLKGEESLGGDSYTIEIEDDRTRVEGYQLDNFNLYDLENSLTIDFTTDNHSYEIHELYSQEYKAKKLYDKLDNQIPNKDNSKKNKI